MIMPEDEAAEEADVMSEPVDEVDEKGVPWFRPDYVGDPRVYSAALLDLLSCVSDETAQKAWQMMRISSEEGEARRAKFRETELLEKP